jgi:hypothetical protein
MAFGLRPIGNISADETTATTEYAITSGASAIYYGDLVKQLTDGSIAVCAAADVPIGVFCGCTYYNAKGEMVVSPNYDAPTSPTDITGLVWDDPSTKFEILANADVTAANIGAQYDISYAAGSTVNGKSGVTLDISSLATTGKTFRMTALSNRVGDNARVVQVVFAEHVLKGVVSGVGGI